jgi:hypothetical protein
MSSSVLERYDAQIKIYETLLSKGLNKGLVSKLLDYFDQIEFGAKVMKKKFAKNGARLAKSLAKQKMDAEGVQIINEIDKFFERVANGE